MKYSSITLILLFFVFGKAGKDKKCKDKCFGPSKFTLETTANADDIDKKLVATHANLFSGIQSDLTQVQQDWNAYAKAIANATSLPESSVWVIDAPVQEWDNKKQRCSREVDELGMKLKFETDSKRRSRNNMMSQNLDFFGTEEIVNIHPIDVNVLNNPNDGYVIEDDIDSGSDLSCSLSAIDSDSDVIEEENEDKIEWTVDNRKQNNILHPGLYQEDLALIDFPRKDFKGSYRASSTSINRVKNNGECPRFNIELLQKFDDVELQNGDIGTLVEFGEESGYWTVQLGIKPFIKNVVFVEPKNLVKVKKQSFPVGIFAMEDRIGSIYPVYVGNECHDYTKDLTYQTDRFCFDITAIRDSKEYKKHPEVVENLLPNTYVSQFNLDGKVWDRFFIIRHGQVQNKMKFRNLVRNTVEGSGYKGRKGIAFSWMLHGNVFGMLHNENAMVAKQTEIWNATAELSLFSHDLGLNFLQPLNVYANVNGTRGRVNSHVNEVLSNLKNATGFDADIPVFQEDISDNENPFDSAKRKIKDVLTTFVGASFDKFAYFLLELVSFIVTNAYFHLKRTDEVFLLFFNCKSGLDRTGYIYALFIAYISIMPDFSKSEAPLEEQREQLRLFRQGFLENWKTEGHRSKHEKQFRHVFLQTMISISTPITYISTGIRGIKSPSFKQVIKEFLPLGDELNIWPAPHLPKAVQKFINDAGKKRGA